MKTILFRVDGGNAYGMAMGHTYRCKRLAQYLTERGWACRFSMRQIPAGVDLISRSGFPVDMIPVQIPEESAVQFTIESALRHDSIIFMDLPRASRPLLHLAATAKLFTLVYEDRCSLGIEPDILINPTPYVVEYGVSTSPTRCYFGQNYLIIDPHTATPPTNDFSGRIERLFVNFGGADPCNVTSRCLRLLLELDEKHQIFVLLGPAFADHAEIESIISTKDHERCVTLFEATERPIDIQRRCDAAISAGGNTAYELCSQGIPTLILPTIDHEQRLAGHLAQQGWVDALSANVNEVSDQFLKERLSRFILDSMHRHKIHHRIRGLNLSQGLSRVGQILIDVLETTA